MKCPFCQSEDLKVIDKRESDDGSNRRRRECGHCNRRFTTYERIEMIDLKIVKKDGKREPYNRDKILKGLTISCGKLPISLEKIHATLDAIEADIFKMEATEVDSNKIGELVMKHLKALDDIAYIRFASVYKKFQDIDDFKKEIKNLK